MENQPNQAAAQQPMQQPEDDEINLMDLLLVIAKHNRFIFKLTGAATVLAVAVSLLMSNVYTAKVMIMPPQQSQSSAASMLLGQISAISGGLAGSDKNPSALYAAMLKSRTIADALIQRYKLLDVYDVKTYIAARKKLENAVTISSGKEGMITLEFDDKDDKLAAAIANGYIEELDNLVRTLAAKEASGRKSFFENQLKEVRDDLGRAELEMKTFQEQNRVFRLGGEGGMVLGASGGIPKAELEYVRRARDVKYQEMLLGMVAQQVTTAKIDTAKDTPVIQVVDKALPPEKKSKPKRALIVLLTTLVSLFIGILWAFLKEAAERTKQYPEQAERISLLRRYFRQGS